MILELVEQGGSETHLGRLAVAGNIEICCTGRIHRYEDIRHDTTAAIDRPPANCPEDSRRINLDAVFIKHLSAGITGQYIITVFFLRAAVRFLDAASRRSIEPRHRNPDARAVSKETRLLHQALAERTAPYDDAPIVILDGSREDFARRSG